MLYTVFSLLLTIGSVLASPAANFYVESVLRGPLQNELRALGLDPAPMPKFSTEFQDKVVIIGKVKGKADYYDGKLFGLSSAVRFTECQGPSYSFGTGRVNCTLSLNYLTTNYKANVKYGKVPKVSIKADANITRSIVFVEFFKPHAQPAEVNSMQILELGQVMPKFTGLGSALNKFLKVLSDGYKSHVGAEVFNTISQRFRFALSRAAAHVSFPI